MSITKIENPLADPTGQSIEDTYGRQNVLLSELIRGYRDVKMGQVVFPGTFDTAPAVFAGSIFEYNGELYRVDSDEEVPFESTRTDWDSPQYVVYDGNSFVFQPNRNGYYYNKEKKGYYRFGSEKEMLIDIVSSFSVGSSNYAVFESMRQVHRGHIYLNAKEIENGYYDLWDITYGEFKNEGNAQYLCTNELKGSY